MANDAELLADLLDGRFDPADAPAELAELAELATAVSQHITLVPPTPDFRAALREEVLQAGSGPGAGTSDGGGTGSAAAGGGSSGGSAGSAAGGATAATYGTSGLPAVIAAVAATAVLATGTYTITTESVPGDPLYGLKQGVESLQLTIADDHRDVELLVGFATERVREAVRVADPALVSDLLAESDRLLDDALALAVEQGRQVQDLLDGYAGALVTLESRTDDPTIQAQLDELLDDVGIRLSDPLPDGGPPVGGDDQDRSTDEPRDEQDGGTEEPADQPDGPAAEDPASPMDDPLDELDDPLDELDDPLDDLDDPLDELDDPLDDDLDEPLDELDEPLDELGDALGG